MKEAVKNTIYEIRTAADITQEKLSEKIGVSRQTIIAIEKGNYVPSVLLALRLAKFFKRPVEELFYLS
ncbi:MAG TPA: helix-turn-helix transcriptional regulator [Candidatus Paceibacterota bacterium]|nr:helix-turn-helix transcriptional regulator [Candidatus Paceibacterota bacterium]